MRTAGLVVLSGLLLAGCDQGPTFDASSLPAYQKSLSEIHAQLGADDRRRLDAALVMIAGGNSVDVTQLSSGGRVVVLPALDGVAGPLIYLDRLRPVINGKSAAKVIKTVADGLDYQIGRAEKQRADANIQLNAIEIANPRYYWNRGKYADQPEIAFSVFNGGKVAISGIVLRGTLTLRGRTVATGGANYNFARVLQPGERQSAKSPPMPAWPARIWKTSSTPTLRCKSPTWKTPTAGGCC